MGKYDWRKTMELRKFVAPEIVFGEGAWLDNI